MDEAREALHVFAVDLDKFRDFFWIVSVVGEGVVPVFEHFPVESEDLATAWENEGEHAGGVALEGECHEVEHDGFALDHEVWGDGIGGGEFVGDFGDGVVGAGELFADAGFYFAEGGEVLVQFGAVVGVDG